jgi:aminoglycoside 2'-N-acetyltransferase I
MGHDAGVTRVKAMLTRDFSGGQLAQVRNLLVEAFEGDFSDDDWEHTIGGCHFVVLEGDSIVSHASVVPRVLEVASRPLQVGYVEGVATHPLHRLQGSASAVMAAASDHIRSQYEMGALGTDLFSLYERVGWERWKGPTYVRRTDGLFHSEEEDGYVMVLRFGPSSGLDLWAPISCEERSGDDW